MSLPTYDINSTEAGGAFETYAGEEILDEMDRKRIEVATIIITMFDAFGQGGDYITLGELV
ncbi:response regulator, partial [Aduncisulcus paluster]